MTALICVDTLFQALAHTSTTESSTPRALRWPRPIGRALR